MTVASTERNWCEARRPSGQHLLLVSQTDEEIYLGAATLVIVEGHFSFKIWPLLRDLIDSKPLNSLEEYKRLRTGLSLHADDLGQSSVREQVIFRGLCGVDVETLLTSATLSSRTVDELLPIPTEEG